MADIVTPIITTIVQSLMVPIKKHLRYLISYTKYVKDMHIKKNELDNTKIYVETRKKRNEYNSFIDPPNVPNWLNEVKEIEERVKKIPSDGGVCFNLKNRYELGRKAFQITQDIDRLIAENSRIKWDEHRNPLGKVDSIKATITTTSSDHDDFDSREITFKEALKALEPNHKSHMIALWGMGGVGKTTMMEKLKKVAKEKKLFDMIVPLVIGENMNTTSVQDAAADYLGIELDQKSVQARGDMLRNSFENYSKEGSRNKILVILDDVWESIDLNVFGLSPLPNQGVGFKLLLTSRDLNVCTEMGVEANSIFSVGILTDQESQSLFLRIVKSPGNNDLARDLYKIGDDIVRKCRGLPIAIKTIACTLKGKEKPVWEDARTHLEHYDIHKDVSKVFKVSYNNLKDEETKSVLLLCGLYPEDFNIPMEELVRYGWSLQLFNKVYTIREARYRLISCIDQLVSTNLLIKSNCGWVKMHDLIRAFVLGIVSTVEHASSIVIHDNISNWTEKDTTESCKRISLTCTGMSEFPRDFKYPNLSLLNLRKGEKVRFPIDFYEEMKKLEVIAYEKIHYPLPPKCSTNLRMLSLHNCRLMSDCSYIGYLLNLEVLSFANCGIQIVPFTIGNLKKLKLLDLTGSKGLHIDNGVLEKLVNLEELYMIVNHPISFPPHVNIKAIRFTYENYSALVERSKNLSTLEIEFSDYNDQLKNMSYEKLERFKISLGCFLTNTDSNMHAFKNTLMLNTNQGKLLESRIHELFENTEVLHLKVDGMNNLEIVDEKVKVKSFNNLRVLNISECTQLGYLFTCHCATTLSKLEHLEISRCDNLEALIHIESGGEKTITFPKLKVLYLDQLPKLLGFCNNVNVVELPQLVELRLKGLPKFTCIYPKNKLATSSMSNYTSEFRPFLNQEVVIPKLEQLCLSDMENLKEIWPCQFNSSEEVNIPTLREITVERCDSLMNLFPTNPMLFLHHLEDLTVKNCLSIEVLFNIELGCVGKFEQVTTRLRNISVLRLGKLKELWRINGANYSHDLIPGFQALEYINIKECTSFRNIFTPTTVNIDLAAVTYVDITDCGQSERNSELVKDGQKQKINGISKKTVYEVDGYISNVAFPSYLIHTNFPRLHKLCLEGLNGVGVGFEIKSSSSSKLGTPQITRQPLLLSSLDNVTLSSMESMSHVWKCNWKEFLTLHRQQPESSFYNLTTITLYECKNIKYLFSPFMAELLSNLKNIHISFCDGVEEVVSSRDDEDKEMATSSNTLFPRLYLLNLSNLENLKNVGGGCGGAKGVVNELLLATTSIQDQSRVSQVGSVSWSLCQYSRNIFIEKCMTLSSAVPFCAIERMQKLEKLEIYSCNSMIEVFETQWIDKSGSYSTNVVDTTMAIPRPENFTMLKLPNLKKMEIGSCDLLEYIFPFSTLENLRQLEELRIRYCKAMKVIVKEENGEQIKASNIVVFSRLKCIELVDLPNLVGFFLGVNINFQWPLLDSVKIEACPQLTVFTSGQSTTPNLRYIHTSLGKHTLECGLNFPVTTTLHQNLFPSLDSSSLWFHNLMEAVMHNNSSKEKIVSSSELLQLQKLEKIDIYICNKLTEVFEVLDETNNSGLSESRYVVELPNLREVELQYLARLKYIWKSNELRVLKFPNLTKLFIMFCHNVQHVFTCSMVGSLLQLQELEIDRCQRMVVIVRREKKDEYDGKVINEIMLPCLKSLKLNRLSRLKGFCLGKEAFSLPSLYSLKITDCPNLTIFTKGHLAIPELTIVETSSGVFYGKGGINSIIKTNQERSILQGKCQI